MTTPRPPTSRRTTSADPGNRKSASPPCRPGGTHPAHQTARMSRVAEMSSSGSPSIRTRSARRPGAIVPRSVRPNARAAPVTARSAATRSTGQQAMSSPVVTPHEASATRLSGPCRWTCVSIRPGRSAAPDASISWPRGTGPDQFRGTVLRQDRGRGGHREGCAVPALVHPGRAAHGHPSSRSDRPARAPRPGTGGAAWACPAPVDRASAPPPGAFRARAPPRDPPSPRSPPDRAAAGSRARRSSPRARYRAGRFSGAPHDHPRGVGVRPGGSP